MYVIGNVILGTHLPWDKEVEKKLTIAYAKAKPEGLQPYIDSLNTEPSIPYETVNSVIAGLEDDSLDWEELEWWDTWGEEDGWQKEYHGSGPSTVAWIGEQVGEFDETDHFPLSDITDMESVSPEVKALARQKYEALPKEVRNVLPPFGLYVVWSSS